jgi:hypothetical protein
VSSEVLRGLGAAPRQDHASHAAVNRRLFVTGRAEAAVARGQIRRAAEDRRMPIQPRDDVRAWRTSRYYGYFVDPDVVDCLSGGVVALRRNGHRLAVLRQNIG